MTENFSILSFDNIMPNVKQTAKFAIRSAVATEDIGTESGESFVAQEYFLKGLSVEDARKLRDGETYLVFDVIAMDCSKPTANGRRYPMDVFISAMKDEEVVRKMNHGGFPGEGEHPELVVPENEANAQAAIRANMQRIVRIDPKNKTHYIIGWHTEGDNMIFTIKTSLDNRQIVNDLLNGHAPTFSIRTTGQFEPENDHVVAKALKFITIDYVMNPANATSKAKPDMIIKHISPEVKEQKIQMMTTLAPTGTESFEGFESLIPEDSELFFDSSLGMEDIMQNIVIKKKEPKPFDLREHLKKLNKSFM